MPIIAPVPDREDEEVRAPKRPCVKLRIRRFINQLPAGAIFVTRDVLRFGCRATVDVTLWRMVRAGELIRHAWGVFQKADGAVEKPTLHSLVQTKAKAFQREIFTAGENAELWLTGEKSGAGNVRKFACTGPSSRFRVLTYNVYAILHRCCPRKLKTGDAKTGLLMRGLWQEAKGKLDSERFGTLTSRFKRADRRQIYNAAPIMPACMTDGIKSMNGNAQWEFEKLTFRPLRMYRKVHGNGV